MQATPKTLGMALADDAALQQRHITFERQDPSAPSCRAALKAATLDRDVGLYSKHSPTGVACAVRNRALLQNGARFPGHEQPAYARVQRGSGLAVSISRPWAETAGKMGGWPG